MTPKKVMHDKKTKTLINGKKRDFSLRSKDKTKSVPLIAIQSHHSHRRCNNEIFYKLHNKGSMNILYKMELVNRVSAFQNSQHSHVIAEKKKPARENGKPLNKRE